MLNRIRKLQKHYQNNKDQSALFVIICSFQSDFYKKPIRSTPVSNPGQTQVCRSLLKFLLTAKYKIKQTESITGYSNNFFKDFHIKTEHSE